MFSFVWPIALVIVANTVYQICAKSVPESMDPLASLTVTYLVSAAASALLYFVLNRGGSLLREYSQMNWAPVALGVVIIGLEVGYIYAYKAGWQVGTAFVIQSVFVAAALLLVGFLVYRESLSFSKVAGVLICAVGLYFIKR